MREALAVPQGIAQALLQADRTLAKTELELSEPRVWMNDIQLGLGLWQGFYGESDRVWLRWYDATANWILTPQERERQQAEQVRQEVERERRRVERLAEQLR